MSLWDALAQEVADRRQGPGTTEEKINAMTNYEAIGCLIDAICAVDNAEFAEREQR